MICTECQKEIVEFMLKCPNCGADTELSSHLCKVQENERNLIARYEKVAEEANEAGNLEILHAEENPDSFINLLNGSSKAKEVGKYLGQIDDAVLVDEFVNKGSREAFDTLMKKHQESIYRQIYRMVRNPEDAQDLTQETFMKAYTELHTIRDSTKLRSWLWKIAHRKAIDKIRKSRITDSAVQEDVMIINHEMEELLEEERKELLLEAIKRLPERQREVVQMVFVEGYSRKEIAEKMDCSRGNIRTLLSLAMKNLREFLAQVDR